jgi:hypothetical protein
MNFFNFKFIIYLICQIAIVGCGEDTIKPDKTDGNDQKEKPVKEESGLLFYGKQVYAKDTSVISSPYIGGGFFQIIWSEVEKADGECDWSEVDSWIKPWKDAGKKVALRIMWSTSGYWPMEYYKHPTPQWVWGKGAKFAYHSLSKTEIPLIWDPIYKYYAFRFLREIAKKFNEDQNVLFIDVTPGAETNPYRFGTIDERSPEFRKEYLNTISSDGKKFSEELWFNTIFEWIDSTKVIFNRLPLLVTLNVGNMPGGKSQLDNNGNYLVSKNYYVGQNGLKGSTPTRENFVEWSKSTKIFFEMVAKSGGTTGTLMEVMQAAERNKASYLNVYPEDVRKGTKGLPEYQKEHEDALKYGADVIKLKN